ncbi:hypothetical protein L0222_26295 [bacterium]|nr:hypothetical protein [bacterium]MCI0601543.1 hypothetical protein [bacterium]
MSIEKTYHFFSFVNPKSFVVPALSLFAPFLFAVSVPAQTCITPPSDLISWWPGDGNANDIAGGSPGILQNGATFGLGLIGQAFSFDGGDDFISVSNVANLETQQFTIDAWVFPEGHGNFPDSIGA